MVWTSIDISFRNQIISSTTTLDTITDLTIFKIILSQIHFFLGKRTAATTATKRQDRSYILTFFVLSVIQKVLVMIALRVVDWNSIHTEWIWSALECNWICWVSTKNVIQLIFWKKCTCIMLIKWLLCHLLLLSYLHRSGSRGCQMHVFVGILRYLYCVLWWWLEQMVTILEW